MLTISQKLPVTSRRCLSQSELTTVLSALIRKSISFYVEPEPDDLWLIMVEANVGHVLDSCFASSPTAEKDT